jgi:hypothetical protein
MKARIGLWSMGILATFGVACGGGSAAKPLTADDYCGQRAEKECVVVAETCSAEQDDCTDKRKQDCLNEVASVMAPRVFVEANVAACINKTASVYAQASIKPADLEATNDLCNYVFQGSVATNEACETKYDCKDKTQVCDKGLCAAKLTKAKDALCADPGAICPTGQYCTMMGQVLKCVDKKGSAETCDAVTPCLETLRCTMGKCAPLLMDGDTCESNADCPTDAPFCDPYAGKECVKGLTFATHSPSCAPFGDSKAPAATGAAGSGAAGTGAAGSGAAGTGAAGSGAAGSDGGGAAGSDGGTDAASAE